MSVLDGPLVFVDIETNGLSHVSGRIIEVAAIRVEAGEIVSSFNTLIDPQTELPQFITNLTGIHSADLKSAPTFEQIADELQEIMQDCMFVAHNVRFDYSFLKQELKRIGKTFCPKQLCTVKLSKALYPTERSHKLESLIQRHGFNFTHRHRAYDDAHVLWQFMQHAEAAFGHEHLEAIAATQLKRPSLPKEITPSTIDNLPEAPGVYIFEDENGKPLYIGKSINIKKRVLQHFGHDHDTVQEFKITQNIHSISTHITNGELEALLLESQMVKDMQPLYNRKLRRVNKLLVARFLADDFGYNTVVLEEAATINPEELGSVLAVYARRSNARASLEAIRTTYDLCPKLLGLEKTKHACFLYQLRKCRGACVGKETATSHNQRLEIAFERQRIQDWPYKSAVIVQEQGSENARFSSGIIVDKWCVIAKLKQEEYCEPVVELQHKNFDLDTYKILQLFMTQKLAKLRIQPISYQQAQQFGI